MLAILKRLTCDAVTGVVRGCPRVITRRSLSFRRAPADEAQDELSDGTPYFYKPPEAEGAPGWVLFRDTDDTTYWLIADTVQLAATPVCACAPLGSAR